MPSSPRLSVLLDRLAFGAFVLLALVFPFERTEPIVVLAGLEKITTAELPMRVGTAFWLLSLLAAWRRPRLPAGLTFPALLWLGLMVASAWMAPQYSADAIRFTLRMALALLVGWAVYDLVAAASHPARRWRWLAQAMALAGAAVAVIGLLEASQHPAILAWLRPFKGAPTFVGDILRVSSTLPYATIAAMVLEMTLPLVLAWALTAQRGWARALLALALLVGLTALALTLTRAGVLALLAVLVLMAVVGWQRGQRSLVLGSLRTAGVLACLVGLILVANPTAGLRLRTETEQNWYQAAYKAPERLTVSAASLTTAPVLVTNTSVRDWESGGPTPFLLSYHLLRPDGRQLQYDGPRSPLPRTVRPGEQIELRAILQAPSQPGEYVVEWDMLQEGVAWFSWKGATPARTSVTVTAGSSAGPPLVASPSAGQVVRIPPPGRLDLWRAALRMSLARPLLGVGPDNFRLVYGVYAGLKTWDPNIHANNLYLEWMAGTGGLGLLAFLWLNAAILWRSWQGSRPQPGRAPEAMIWRLAVFAGLAAWFVHGLLDSFYEFTPTYTAFWLLAGLGLSASSGD